MKLCAQHCAQVSNLRVPHRNSTSTSFSTAYEVLSCSTQLLVVRTIGQVLRVIQLHACGWLKMVLTEANILVAVIS